MQFRILGPVEALGPNGRTVRPRGQTLRLLGLLLVRRGTTVAVDSAVDALWGEQLPAHPDNALQLVVSRLRRALGADAVVRDAGGYSLRLTARDIVDADRFGRLATAGEAALARGEPAVAAELLRAALALWRGPALHGVRYESYAAAEIARLEEQRATCLAARIDADLALGHPERVLDELSALVVEHPLRESFRRQLVRALMASGRRAEALAARRAGRAEVAPEDAPPPARRTVVCVAVELRATGPVDLEVRDDVLGVCADEVEAIAGRHGDAVVAAVPEGVLAVFGAARTHEDEAARAVRAATALQRRLGELARAVDFPLEVRIGVTAGTALVRDPAVLPSGEVLATSARLARSTRPGGLALDASVRPAVSTAQEASPWVGRDAELERLEHVVRGLRAGRSELMLLLGEPGIGKSRLVREFAGRMRSRARVLVGHCPAYGDGVTYWPLREIVLQAQDGQPLDTLLEPTEEGQSAAAAISAALGLGGHAPPDALPWAFGQLFAALGRDRPLVLVLEDVHWAEPPLLDLIDDIVAGPLAARVLVLCAGRPELLVVRPAWAAAPRLSLSPLDDRAAGRLLAARAALPEPELGRVVAQARGNPLFLEQLAAHVGERSAAGALPPALHALLAARLDALSTPQRRLLEAGAAEGELFHVGGLAALEPALGEPAAALEALVRRELVLPAEPLVAGETASRDRHALVRDAAYAATSLDTRAGAHERLADWMAGLGDALPEADARIAAQLERAHGAGAALRMPEARLEPLARRAAARLADAARDVHRRGDLPSEIAFLERALALLGRDDPARVELLPAIGAALFEAGSLDRAAAVAERAIESGGDTRVRWRGEVERERLHAYRHPETVDSAASLRVAERAARALEDAGDTLGVARARYLMCELVWMQGRSERGLANAREVVRLARRAKGAVELDAGMSFVAWALVVNRVPVAQARAECEAMLREVAGRRFAELGLRGFAAVLDAMAGHFAAAREQLARSRSGLNDLGLREPSLWMAMFDSMAELLAGDFRAAHEALDDAEQIAIEVGDRWFLSTVLVDRAHVVLGLERPDAAAAVARIDDVPAPHDAEWNIMRHAARGKLAAREGDADRALAEAHAAVELADSTEMFLYRADAWRDLAEVATRVDAADEAEHARETALALYREKGNVAAARQLLASAPAPRR